MGKCDCYYQHGSKPVCYGTKEMEECSCGGDERKCNFYPEKRKQKMANEKRLDLIDRGALGIGRANPLVFDKIEYAHGWNCAIEIIQNAPTVDAVELPCKMGDLVWGIKNFNRGKKVLRNSVNQMYFGDDMRLCICVKGVCRGEWGKNIFATKEEAEKALAKMGGDGNED